MDPPSTSVASILSQVSPTPICILFIFYGESPLNLCSYSPPLILYNIASFPPYGLGREVMGDSDLIGVNKIGPETF